MDMLSILGSLASIVGACVSWWQYKKAKSAAEEAKEAKMTVLNRQQISEIEKVLMSAREAEGVLIGRTSRRLTNQGKNLSVEYEKIQKFISEFNEIYESFTSIDLRNPLEFAHKSLANTIQKYTNENENLQKDALSMLEDIRRIISFLKNEQSRKKYR